MFAIPSQNRGGRPSIDIAKLYRPDHPCGVNATMFQRPLSEHEGPLPLQGRRLLAIGNLLTGVGEPIEREASLKYVCPPCKRSCVDVCRSMDILRLRMPSNSASLCFTREALIGTTAGSALLRMDYDLENGDSAPDRVRLDRQCIDNLDRHEWRAFRQMTSK